MKHWNVTVLREAAEFLMKVNQGAMPREGSFQLPCGEWIYVEWDFERGEHVIVVDPQ